MFLVCAHLIDLESNLLNSTSDVINQSNGLNFGLLGSVLLHFVAWLLFPEAHSLKLPTDKQLRDASKKSEGDDDDNQNERLIARNSA